MGTSISPRSGSHTVTLAVFGSKLSFPLITMSDLLVGVGFSLGNSAAGVFVVAFTGITYPGKAPA